MKTSIPNLVTSCKVAIVIIILLTHIVSIAYFYSVELLEV